MYSYNPTRYVIDLLLTVFNVSLRSAAIQFSGENGTPFSLRVTVNDIDNASHYPLNIQYANLRFCSSTVQVIFLNFVRKVNHEIFRSRLCFEFETTCRFYRPFKRQRFAFNRRFIG